MSASDVIALILLSGVVGGAWIIYFKLAQKIDDLDERHDAKHCVTSDMGVQTCTQWDDGETYP